MTSIRRAVILMGMAVALAQATAATAAPLTLEFSSGLNTVTVTDGGVGDANPAAGAITFIGSVGSWNLNVGTGVGQDVLGPATMDLASISAAFLGAADPLTVMLSQTGVTLPVTGFVLDFGGTGTNLASVAYSAYVDDANNAFALSQLIATVGPFNTPSFSGSTSGSVSVTGPYSLTQVLSIQGGYSRLTPYAMSMYSGDAQLTPEVRTERVPEPASLTLFGGALSTVGMWLRRRRTAQA